MLLKNFIFALQNTPWKIVSEIKMLLIKPFIILYFKLLKGVNIGNNCKFYGFPKVMHCNGSYMEIGDRFECRSSWDSNPLGINHPTIICTWKRNALIEIGNDVGISGGSIVAAEKIKIGDGTLIGANTTIIDTDFHPLLSSKRRYSKNGIKVKPVIIGKNVFIGMNCVILKGVTIPDNAIVPAGAIVRKWNS